MCARHKRPASSQAVVSVPAPGLVNRASPNGPARQVRPGQGLKLWPNSHCERMDGTQIQFVTVAPVGNNRAANHLGAELVCSSTIHSTQGTGTQGKTRGQDSGHDIDPCRFLHGDFQTLTPGEGTECRPFSKFISGYRGSNLIRILYTADAASALPSAHPFGHPYT